MATLFTTETPGIPDVNDGSGISLGTGLKFDIIGEVSAIRFYAPTTVGSSSYVGAIYRIDTDDVPIQTGTGTLLGSATFSTVSGGTWNEVSLSSPVVVDTVNVYKAVVYSPEGRYTATSSFFSSALVNGHITGYADITDYGFGNLYNGTYIVAGSLSYPDNTFNANCYFVDVQFSVGINVGIGSETDSAQTITTTKVVGVGIAGETESAQVVNVVHVSSVGLASETESGLSTTAVKVVSIGLGSSTDSGVPITRANYVSGPVSYTINTGSQTFTVNTGSQTFAVNTGTQTFTVNSNV